MAGGAALLGVIAMFLLMRAFHVHTHDEFDELAPESHSHDQPWPRSRPLTVVIMHTTSTPNSVGWECSLASVLHTLMDGVALGASVAAETYHSPFLGLAGLGTSWRCFCTNHWTHSRSLP